MNPNEPVGPVDPRHPLGQPETTMFASSPAGPFASTGGATVAAHLQPTTLEHTLTAVELSLIALGEALRLLDTRAIDSHASELHRALARAVDRFSDAAREGPVALGLRQRLALASGRVAAQRNALAQATAALDRAIDSLLPGQSPPSESVEATAEARAG